jgi:rhamnosyltransferase
MSSLSSGPVRGDSPLAAAITVFKPAHDHLQALIAGLLADGLRVFVYVDGPVGIAIDADGLDAVGSRTGVTVLSSSSNCGLGAGLNILVDAARSAGVERLIVFDQDSSPSRGMTWILNNALNHLRASGLRPAAVGPEPVVPDGESGKAPSYRRGSRAESLHGCVPVPFLITSGSLFDLETQARVGRFREDYFIDALDTEWCFRAASRGHPVFMCEAVTMAHRVGNGVVRFGPLAFPRQSIDRMSFYVRNQIYSLRLPHVPLSWKARLACYLPVQMLVYWAGGGDRRTVARRLVKAVADGLAGRLGP